jgi:hypothetical protein
MVLLYISRTDNQFKAEFADFAQLAAQQAGIAHSQHSFDQFF